MIFIVCCITLTTDFGTRDWFVGTMKGVILGLAPRAKVVDLTHEIPPGNIRAGAFSLATSYSFFPRDTIHVAVVDPGVGTQRRAIAVRTSSYLFVGPDNGLLSWALAKEKVQAIYALQNKAYFLSEVSATFHGRDVFAPVAAHLTRGVAPHKLGPPLNDCIRLEWPETKPTRQGIQGEVLYIDRFGNAITNIAACMLGTRANNSCAIVRGKRICSLVPTYHSVPPGRPVAVISSSGFVEIAVNCGDAAMSLGLCFGSKVELREGPASPPHRRLRRVAGDVQTD